MQPISRFLAPVPPMAVAFAAAIAILVVTLTSLPASACGPYGGDRHRLLRAQGRIVGLQIDGDQLSWLEDRGGDAWFSVRMPVTGGPVAERRVSDPGVDRDRDRRAPVVVDGLAFVPHDDLVLDTSVLGPPKVLVRAADLLGPTRNGITAVAVAAGQAAITVARAYQSPMLFLMPRSGGPARTLGVMARDSHVAFDDTHVWWLGSPDFAAWDAEDIVVRRIPLTGGPVERVAVAGPGGTSQLAAHDGVAYWVKNRNEIWRSQ